MGANGESSGKSKDRKERPEMADIDDLVKQNIAHGCDWWKWIYERNAPVMTINSIAFTGYQ